MRATRGGIEGVGEAEIVAEGEEVGVIVAEVVGVRSSVNEGEEVGDMVIDGVADGVDEIAAVGTEEVDNAGVTVGVGDQEGWGCCYPSHFEAHNAPSNSHAQQNNKQSTFKPPAIRQNN